MNMVQSSNAVSMSSVELLELVNDARADAGEPKIRANVFADRIKDELDGEHYKSFVVQNLNGTQSEVFDLTRDQCALVSMRESKSVRRKVLAKLNALESKLSQPIAMPSYAESLRLLADQIEETARVTAERDLAVATKALIGSKREATAMATAAKASREAAKLRDQLGFNCRHATILAVEHATGGEFAFLGLRRWCKANGVTAETVPDKRYPAGVKAWPAAAWMAVYGIELVELFGSEVAA